MNEHEQAQFAHHVALGLTVTFAVFNIAWLLLSGTQPWYIIFYRSSQYTGLLFLLLLPFLLRSRYRLEVPRLLSVLIVLYELCALILGDGLQLTGRVAWWDKLVHAEAALMLTYSLLWETHLVMSVHKEWLCMNRYVLAGALVLVSAGLGADWELLKYAFSSRSEIEYIYTHALYFEDPLRDTMMELLMYITSGLFVALIGFIRHDQLAERYQLQKIDH